MPYIPHTEADVAEMLAVIGVSSIDDLFCEVPENLRLAPGSLDIPNALDEPKLYAHLLDLASKNVDLSKVTCFLGAGIYDRYIPATVGAVISRGEFLTAYTPYQPEASQGYLQAIYEFQTMVAELYGCDIANASMYDGATSMAEAAMRSRPISVRTAWETPA
jgi:glycine dehydrogenase subunit 1